MTTGTIHRDGRTPLYLGNVGILEDVSWSGADTPRFSEPYRRRTYRTVTYTVPYTIRYGKRAGQSIAKTVRARVIDDPGTGYVDRRKRRDRPENAYSKVGRHWRSVAVTPVDWFGPETKGSDWIWTTLGGDPPLPDLVTPNDHNQMINRLWAKVQGSDFNLANFLGESNQTLALIGDAAIRVAKCYFFARKGDAKGAFRSLVEGTSRAPLQKRFDAGRTARLYPNLPGTADDISRLLLEIQYGWRPLVNDVRGAAEMLAQELSVPRKSVQTVVCRRNGPTERLVSGDFWGYYQDEYGNLQSVFGPGSCVFPSAKQHVRKIKAIFTENNVPSLPARLGLANPEIVAWELLPFSFLADWFIPIGPALEARAVASALTGTFVTTDFRRYHEGSAHSFTGTLAMSLGSCPGDFVRYTIDRTVTDHLYSMLPEVKPFAKAASFEHCLNAVALAVQSPFMGLDDLKGEFGRSVSSRRW